MRGVAKATVFALIVRVFFAFRCLSVNTRRNASRRESSDRFLQLRGRPIVFGPEYFYATEDVFCDRRKKAYHVNLESPGQVICGKSILRILNPEGKSARFRQHL